MMTLDGEVWAGGHVWPGREPVPVTLRECKDSGNCTSCTNLGHEAMNETHPLSVALAMHPLKKPGVDIAFEASSNSLMP
jgi:hypothetical protein